MAHFDAAALADAPTTDAPAQELAWFAIRQPAVVRFLERRLWAPDGDAFAVALDAVCRLHAAVTLRDGLEPVRVDDRLLRVGLDLEPPPSLGVWVRGLCHAAPVILTDDEEARVAAAVAAVAWGFAAGRARGGDERMIGA